MAQQQKEVVIWGCSRCGLAIPKYKGECCPQRDAGGGCSGGPTGSTNRSHSWFRQ